MGRRKVFVVSLFLGHSERVFASRMVSGFLANPVRFGKDLPELLLASEQKYKRLLLNWAPLSAWVGAVASDDDAVEDEPDDDAAMRKAKTLARLQKSF